MVFTVGASQKQFILVLLFITGEKRLPKQFLRLLGLPRLVRSTGTSSSKLHPALSDIGCHKRWFEYLVWFLKRISCCSEYFFDLVLEGEIVFIGEWIWGDRRRVKSTLFQRYSNSWRDQAVCIFRTSNRLDGYPVQGRNNHIRPHHTTLSLITFL